MALVTFDDFKTDLVRALTVDGTEGDVLPRTRFYLEGRLQATYFSYHIAATMRLYGEHSGERPWRIPFRLDIRVIRVDNGQMVYSVLPEFDEWLQKTQPTRTLSRKINGSSGP